MGLFIFFQCSKALKLIEFLQLTFQGEADDSHWLSTLTSHPPALAETLQCTLMGLVWMKLIMDLVHFIGLSSTLVK